MKTLQEFFDDVCKAPPFDLSGNKLGFNRQYQDGFSEQSAHLPLLKLIASQCDHVTEFGLREGFTTSALALGTKCKLVSYDLVRHPIHELFNQMKFPCEWQFIERDIVSAGWKIEETDFLFVDDLHTYRQVTKELSLHGDRVKRFLGFHDTYSQGEKSLDVAGETGILPAIQEYAAKGWKLVYKVDFNHGLQIYERV